MKPVHAMAPLIVVIDDDPAFLDMMHALLSDEGYQVRTLIGGELRRTYDCVAREEPDLVVLDLRLASRDDGETIIDRIRRNPRLRRVRLLVCSSDVRGLQQKEGLLREKKCDTLKKPFIVEEMLTKIYKAIGPPPSHGAPSAPGSYRIG